MSEIGDNFVYRTAERNGAIFSPCRRWRYAIWRQCKASLYGTADLGTLLVIGVNPSDADEARDDHTLGKVCGFADHLGYGRAMIVNPFAYVCKDLHTMLRLERSGREDVVGPDNDEWLEAAIRDATTVVVAWGTAGKTRGRDRVLLEMAARAGRTPHAFAVNKDGSPSHPARLPYGQLVVYSSNG